VIGSIAPILLNLGAGWRWGVKATSQPFKPWKELLTPIQEETVLDPEQV